MLKVDVFRGADHRHLQAFCGDSSLEAIHAERAEVALRVSPDWNRLVVMSCLATGFLPWGDLAFPGQPTPRLTQRSGHYPVATCFSFTIETAQLFVDAGFLAPAEDQIEALTITETGRLWLMEHWHRMLASPASQPTTDVGEVFVDAEFEPRPKHGRGHYVTRRHCG